MWLGLSNQHHAFSNLSSLLPTNIIHFTLFTSHQLSFSQPPIRTPDSLFTPPHLLSFYIHHLLPVRYYILLMHGSLTYKSAYQIKYSIKRQQLNSGYAWRFYNLNVRYALCPSALYPDKETSTNEIFKQAISRESQARVVRRDKK